MVKLDSLTLSSCSPTSTEKGADFAQLKCRSGGFKSDISFMGPTIDELLQLEVPVRVVLGQRRMTMHEVRGLLPGSVLELGTMVDEDLEITVGHRSLATGQACRLEDRAAVQITSVGDPAARISALAKEEDLNSDD